MSTAGNDHLNNNDFDSIIFSIKDTKLYVPVVTFQQQTIKNYQNVLAKDVKDQFIGMNMKLNVRLKILQMNLDIFPNQICWSQ